MKRVCAAIISVALLFTTLGIRSVAAQTEERTARAEVTSTKYDLAKIEMANYVQTAEIRERVIKYGVGKKVVVKLRDKTKYKGAITEIANETFEIVDKAGKATTFSFREVDSVKKSGVPVGVWIAIGAAAAVGTIVLVTLAQRCQNEGANALCQ